MKIKHNKKRNTAFVYEILIKEATVAILKKDTKRRNNVINIIKKHFKSDSLLRKDLECYRSLYENQNLTQLTSEKIIKEVKLQKRLLDAARLFKQQTALIHDINKEASSSIFNNFIPNYKTLATIDQIFSDRISPKNQVILENEIVKNMTKQFPTKEVVEPIDNIIYNTFVEKFNNKYESNLLEEQKKLLTYYIASFADNALELKVFLNEEIARLKNKLEEAKAINEIKSDTEMLEKTNKIIERLNGFFNRTIDDNLLLTVMRTQELVKEIYTDASHD